MPYSIPVRIGFLSLLFCFSCDGSSANSNPSSQADADKTGGGPADKKGAKDDSVASSDIYSRPDDYDDDENWPDVVKFSSYSDPMSSTQAGRMATMELAERGKFGTTDGIEVWRILDQRGAVIPTSSVRAGKLVRVDGVIPGRASLADAFIANDYETFPVKATAWDQLTKRVTLSPGRLSNRFEVAMNRLIQRRK